MFALFFNESWFETIQSIVLKFDKTLRSRVYRMFFINKIALTQLNLKLKQFCLECHTETYNTIWHFFRYVMNCNENWFDVKLQNSYLRFETMRYFDESRKVNEAIKYDFDKDWVIFFFLVFFIRFKETCEKVISETFFFWNCFAYLFRGWLFI